MIKRKGCKAELLLLMNPPWLIKAMGDSGIKIVEVFPVLSWIYLGGIVTAVTGSCSLSGTHRATVILRSFRS